MGERQCINFGVDSLGGPSNTPTKVKRVPICSFINSASIYTAINNKNAAEI